jgi:hypothetical protein
MQLVPITSRDKIRVYPFVDDLVDRLYDECEALMENHVESDCEKSIFMMFVMMYFAVHLKLKDELRSLDHSVRKDAVKQILSEAIRNPDTRQKCIQMFESKFRTMFIE